MGHRPRVAASPTSGPVCRVSNIAFRSWPDPAFNPATATAPALPPQPFSLHVGYRWGKDGKLGKDANHANAAGEYLGALVWYGFLFLSLIHI